MKMKENENHTFCFPYSAKSMNDFRRVSLVVRLFEDIVGDR